MIDHRRTQKLLSVVILIFVFVIYELLYLKVTTTLTKPGGINAVEKLQKLEKEDWPRCQRFIEGKENVMHKPFGRRHLNQRDILRKYTKTACQEILQTEFPHPEPSEEETNFPIAYGIFIYQDPQLFEQILKAIYMPQNVYCIHIDAKSKKRFHRVVHSIIRCLPNVFIPTNLVEINWGDISIVNAEMRCFRELTRHEIQWKYYIYLVGQDFPLYRNSEIVKALKGLRGHNNIESFPMPLHNKFRTAYVWEYFQRTHIKKTAPPYNIQIRKGTIHHILTKRFVKYLLKSPVARDFLDWCVDTKYPDETFYPSLQNYRWTPGGISGEQPEYLAKALRWETEGSPCYGKWVRTVCWLGDKDLSWVLGSEYKMKLFAHKIPFRNNENLRRCLTLAIRNRKYPSVTKDRKQDNSKAEKMHSTVTEDRIPS